MTSKPEGPDALRSRLLESANELDALRTDDGHVIIAHAVRLLRDAASALASTPTPIERERKLIERLIESWRERAKESNRWSRGWTDGKTERCADELTALLSALASPPEHDERTKGEPR